MNVLESQIHFGKQKKYEIRKMKKSRQCKDMISRSHYLQFHLNVKMEYTPGDPRYADSYLDCNLYRNQECVVEITNIPSHLCNERKQVLHTFSDPDFKQSPANPKENRNRRWEFVVLIWRTAVIIVGFFLLFPFTMIYY